MSRRPPLRHLWQAECDWTDVAECLDGLDRIEDRLARRLAFSRVRHMLVSMGVLTPIEHEGIEWRVTA